MKKVAIYGQYYSVDAEKEVLILLKTLKKNGIEVFFEKKFYQLLKDNDALKKDYKTYAKFTDLSNEFDVLFTIGGDGTILRAVTYIRKLNIPIFGINAGRLGFLATVQKNEIEKAVELLLKKEYTIQNRSVLEVATLPKSKGFKQLNFALNEVTVTRKNTTSMIGVKAHLNNEYLANYWADGLIISTPTGSTGYSLSCNGPVISPDCKSLVITPIAPHNLNVRPIIINDDTLIDLEVSTRENKYLISLDSRITAVPLDTKITVKKANFTIKTILLNNKSFLKTLRSKLLWGEDTRNKGN